MEPRKVVLLVLGGFAIFVGGFLLHALTAEAPTSSVTQVVEEKIEVRPDARIKVLATMTALPQGIELKAENLTWIDWPADLVHPDYIKQADTPNGMDAFKGAVLRADSRPNEPLLKKTLVRVGDGSSMAALLPRGMRPFPIPISPLSASGGFIMPGDHVDIMLLQKLNLAGGDDKFSPKGPLQIMHYLSQKHPELFNRNTPAFAEKPAEPEDPLADPAKTAATLNGDVRPNPFEDISHALNKQIWSFRIDDSGKTMTYVETIMKNVRVLAIDSGIQRSGGSTEDQAGNKQVQIARGGSMATLEVTPEQVEYLTVAQNFGSLSLSLRGITENRLAGANDIDQIPQISGFFGRFMPGQLRDNAEQPMPFSIMRAGVVSTPTLPSGNNVAAGGNNGSGQNVLQQAPERYLRNIIEPLRPFPENAQPNTAPPTNSMRDLLQLLQTPLPKNPVQNAPSENAPNVRKPL